MATQEQLEQLLEQWTVVWDIIEEWVGTDPLHERIEDLRKTSEEVITDSITHDDLERMLARHARYFHRID